MSMKNELAKLAGVPASAAVPQLIAFAAAMTEAFDALAAKVEAGQDATAEALNALADRSAADPQAPAPEPVAYSAPAPETSQT